MPRAALIAALLLCAAAPSRAETKASAASIAKLQKLAGRVRGLKKGVVVVPARKAAAKVAAKAGKTSKASAPRSNKVSRVTALRSLYRQMAALDYRACRTSNLPRASQLKAKAGLHRLAILGEQAGLDDADLEDPDADADLPQDCSAYPTGTTAAGDDSYGLCYCADPADLAAAEAAVSSDTLDASMDASVDATSAAVAEVAADSSSLVAPDFDTTISRLSRFEKIATRKLSAKATPKALPHERVPAIAEWHYQRAQVYERMASVATKPAFGSVRLGKDGKPQLAGIVTSAKLRKLAARLSSGKGPVIISRPLAKGGYKTILVPRSVMLRNTYATMAALDFRAARLAGLPKSKAVAAKASIGRLANVLAGGRLRRKAGRKAGKKASRKAGVRISDDEDGGDSGGGEVDMGVEPVVYVDNSGGGDAGYADTSSSSDSGYADSGSSSDSSYADSGSSSDSSYADTSSSEDPGFGDTNSSGDSGYADTSSSDDSGYADTGSSSDSGYADAGSSDDSGTSAAPDPDAQAFSGSDDSSGFGPTDLDGSSENAVNDSGSSASPDSGAWGAADLTDSNENAVNDPYAGTSLTDPGYQDPGASAAWGSDDLADSNENAVADTQTSPIDPSDIGEDALTDTPVTPDDSASAGDSQAVDSEDEAAAAGVDNGLAPSADVLDPSTPVTDELWGPTAPAPVGPTQPVDPSQAALQAAYTDSVAPDPTLVNMSASAATALGPVLEGAADDAQAFWTGLTTDNTIDSTHQPMSMWESHNWTCVATGLTTANCTSPDQSITMTDIPRDDHPNPVQPGVTPEQDHPQGRVRARVRSRVRARVARMTVACPAKASKLYAVKSGLAFCSLQRKAGKIAGARPASKPLYSRLARLNRAAMKASRALASRGAPRARKAAMLFARAQAYQRMALAISTRRVSRRAASRRTAQKPAQKAEKVASKASPKSSAKPAKPVVSDDVPAQPAPEQPAVEQPAPAQPSEEELLKKDEQDMDDMGKDMENQIRQRSGQ